MISTSHFLHTVSSRGFSKLRRARGDERRDALRHTKRVLQLAAPLNRERDRLLKGTRATTADLNPTIAWVILWPPSLLFPSS
jgi:hypothetical protein